MRRYRGIPPKWMALAGCVHSCLAATPQQPPGGFVEAFDRAPTTAVLPFVSERWDIAVHSRDIQHWFTLDPMQAGHSLTGAPPPATHLVQDYEDVVYTARDHLMTAINAEGYGVVYLTPNAMADMSQGECVIRFDLSTLRTSRRDWVDLWITPIDDNMQLPLDPTLPDLQGYPRRGLHFEMRRFQATFPGGVQEEWTYFDGLRFDNYAATALPQLQIYGYERQITPSARVRQTFEVRISRTNVKVGIPALNLWWIDTPIADLGFDRGVVQFGHHSYNPAKAGTIAPLGHDTSLAGTANPSPMTWHWDDISIEPALRFDIIGVDRRYTLGSAPTTLRLDRPAPEGSHLRFSAIGSVEVSFDGAPFVPARRQDGSEQAAGNHHVDHFSSYWMPIPQGTSTLDFRIAGEGIWATYGLETMAKDIAVWSAPVGGTGCPGRGGIVPTASHPAPTLGNPQFGLRLEEGLPGAFAFAAVSTLEVETAGCGLGMSLAPQHLAGFGWHIVDSGGTAFEPLPLPPTPALAGTAVFGQWAVLDASGGLGYAGARFAVTPLRRIVLH